MASSFFHSPLISGQSPFHFSSSSCLPSASSSSYANDQTPVSDVSSFPLLTAPYPQSQSDIYYAAEQDGVYSYQPLYSSPASSWSSESKKEKPLQDDHYHRQRASNVQPNIDIHQYANTNYPVKHPDLPFIQNNTPVIVSSPHSPVIAGIDTAISPYSDHDWDQPGPPVSTSLHPPSLSHSHANTIVLSQPQAQYPASRVKQEEISIYPSLSYYLAPQPQHATSPQSCPFDLQSLYSGNSSYDGSGPSSHHGTPAPMQALPLPTPHSSYAHSSAMGYAYETLPQDCYMHPAELSPSELSASLSPQMEFSQSCDPRFVSGNQDIICQTIDRSCLIDEDSEQPVYNVECHKTIQLPRGPINPELMPDFDMKSGDIGADDDADADAEGDVDTLEEYQDDGEDDDLDDDPKDGEYVVRRGRSSSSASTTLAAALPRTLRSRSASSPSATRFSPYQYSPQSSVYRGSRTRRSTTAAASSQGSLLFDQQVQSQSSATSTTSRKRTRPTTPLPVPVPVPNLTKKSRGRGVPTVSTLEISGRRGGNTFSEEDYMETGKRRSGARSHTCSVLGCGKCFARGEHLKRHIRSIHTYEKPHKCPYPGCGKDFSRHDNLGQHMRVHKDYVPPKDSRAYRA